MKVTHIQSENQITDRKILQGLSCKKKLPVYKGKIIKTVSDSH